MDGSLDEQTDVVRKEETISQTGNLVRAGVKKRELTQSNLAPGQNMDEGACGDAGQEPVIVRAMCDFDAIQKAELSFKKGDLLKVDVFEQDKPCLATHLTTKRKGLIPGDLVCKVDNPPQIQDWWSDLEKEKAKKMLLLPGNKQGTFLVREVTRESVYVLSVRSLHKGSGDPCVIHYRIRQRDNGRVYIVPRQSFDSLLALVDHYRANADDLCCKLTDACPKLRPLVHFHELEVPRGSIKLFKKLSDCPSGEVWEGELHDVVDVAVKTLKPGSKSPEAFLAEAKMLHQLRHQKVVQLMAVCTTSEPVCFMTELCVNGNLQKFLREDKGKAVTFPIMIEMASQIAEGMAYLETQHIVHRDLRAANILVGDHHDLKVAGFGMARVLPEGGICVAPESDKFAIQWTAPETILERQNSIKSDAWSFGVLLYEIITFGGVPYPGMSNQEVVDRIALPKPRLMPKPDGPIACPDSYYDIMLKCWARKPEERPTFDYLQNFFDDYLIASESNYEIP